MNCLPRLDSRPDAHPAELPDGLGPASPLSSTRQVVLGMALRPFANFRKMADWRRGTLVKGSRYHTARCGCRRTATSFDMAASRAVSFRCAVRQPIWAYQYLQSQWRPEVAVKCPISSPRLQSRPCLVRGTIFSGFRVDWSRFAAAGNRGRRETFPFTYRRAAEPVDAKRMAQAGAQVCRMPRAWIGAIAAATVCDSMKHGHTSMNHHRPCAAQVIPASCRFPSSSWAYMDEQLNRHSATRYATRRRLPPDESLQPSRYPFPGY